MAFNFNWSPLIADTSRAREMLTTALNKSPKPPIIVDDIIVTELNLGSTPPELEILEIGDLAEDRFRGIFKMTYRGDAYLTLKTRVQANPFNTYLSAKPTFASPQPLAAHSGLTIPLQITLSDIRLSGFVILVFSRQKGLTLVFRNDPLESLKVSSTFDSIAFVRDYLQREIEGQLRVLFMEDLPAILHRLSLRLWSPEYRELDDELAKKAAEDTKPPVDPLASPPQDPVDFFGNPLDENELSSFALDGSTAETHASFSQKNLLRLAALTGSHRTLSLFTPSIGDAVFRAWAGPSERGESGTQTPNVALSSLQRSYSTYASSSSAYSLSGNADSDASSTRPPLTSYHTWHGGAGLSRPHPRRTRKKRVVNLRRKPTDSDSDAVTDTTTPEPSIVPSSAPSVLLEEREEEPLTPPRSPNRVRFGKESGRIGAHLDIQTGTARSRPSSSHRKLDITSESSDLPSTAPPAYTPPSGPLPILSTSKAPLRHRPTNTTMLRSYSLDKLSTAFPSSSSTSAAHSRFPSDLSETGSSGGILEQAWMMKMAGEIARRVGEEKERRQASSKHAEWESRHGRRMMDDAPPAYVV